MSQQAEQRYKLCEVAAGIKYLHGRVPPIVHGDIKGVRDVYPRANVLVDEYGQAKISDFGLTRVIVEMEAAAATTTTTTSAVQGTARFMAPERLAPELYGLARNMDAWTPMVDVFSFGMLLYEITAGHAPFAKSSEMEAFLAIIHRQRPAIPAQWESDPEKRGLSALMQECWRHERAQRPAMAEIIQRLECAGAGAAG
ncbi:kinase-like protein [Calocera cornea HHB12733]|uniref:Kinase-like protein n=1 Tax=Calocera cornea HHB12733 TaxID=1353952 RepID=A0A165E1D3_9BASI|nr:kinase-like protein [Calocera cornea HHB12733]